MLESGEAQVALEPEMVFYQPTPARAVLALLDRAGVGAGDVLVDLGSGLGQVVLLTALLTGATATGIEIEPAYCDHARRSARALGLGLVSVIEADARAAALCEGTVFFLYTPFRGALLQQVLERLRAEAAARPLRICTFGPCTPVVARQGWLATTDALDEAEVAVFRPR